MFIIGLMTSLETNLSNFTGTTYHKLYPLPRCLQIDEEDDQLIRIMLQWWLTQIINDPVAIYNEDLCSFIESEFVYQPIPWPCWKTSLGLGLIKWDVAGDHEILQCFELMKFETWFSMLPGLSTKLPQLREAKNTLDAYAAKGPDSISKTLGLVQRHRPTDGLHEDFANISPKKGDIAKRCTTQPTQLALKVAELTLTPHLFPLPPLSLFLIIIFVIIPPSPPSFATTTLMVAYDNMIQLLVNYNIYVRDAQVVAKEAKDAQLAQLWTVYVEVMTQALHVAIHSMELRQMGAHQQDGKKSDGLKKI
ncbi:hypothetical protein EDD16DRAFT_1522851 [Pisolithus croceorrhizus]|nr:hypothetical protein EDD16DRAFT_1522851 [Pisolithus croceorrhizus]